MSEFRMCGRGWLFAAALVLLASGVWAAATDTDGDGLSDDVEMDLGTNAAVAEKLETVGTWPAREVTRPDLCLVRADFANVGRHRWLWAFHAAKPYTFEGASFILYWDTDDNPQTGRPGMGCEYMFCHSQGAPTVGAFLPAGAPAAKNPRLAIVDGVLYMCCDAEVKAEGDKSRLRYSLLSETKNPYVSVSSSGWVRVLAAPDTDRPLPEAAGDIAADRNFGVTEGLDLIWKLQADPRTVALQSPQADLRGFAYYDTEYRWPAVRGNGRITFTVPRAGRFHPALVVYDTQGREVYDLQVNDKAVGAFLAAEDDNRQRIHFLTAALDLKAGDKLTFRTYGEGAHISEDLLLLAEKPAVRGRRFEVSQVEAGFVAQDGNDRERLTWITTWPTACTVEYWRNPGQVQRVTEPAPLANHRVFLEKLTPGARYSFRVLAPKPAGAQVVTQGSFTFSPRPASPGTVKGASFPLTVTNPYACELRGFPVSNGVPFAHGELGDPAHLRLLDAAGREVPVQAKVTMRWLDGSIKWALLSFAADVPAGKTATYTVEYGSTVKREAPATALQVTRDGDKLTVTTGQVRVAFDGKQSGFPVRLWLTPNGEPAGQGEALNPGQLMGLQLTDAAGQTFDTRQAAESVQIEEAGPLRAVIKVTGHHRAADGKAFLAYCNRFVFSAGSPLIRLYTTWGNDQPEAFTSFKQLSLQLAPPGDYTRWAVGLGEGQVARGQGALSLRQLRDDALSVDPAPATRPAKQRADGWLDVSGERCGLTTMVRDFWQLYPKGLRVSPAGTVSLDLCPEFPAGTYDKETLLDDIKLFFALKGGQYKVRQGMSKQHEVLFYPHTGAFTADLGQLAQAWQDPPLAVCTPERYCGTGVFGDVLPATTGRWPEYEQTCEKVYQGYVGYRESNRNYGLLNFGDQFGERRVNWANGEYDHHHAFLMQFARCADPKWYRLGERAARHAIDVDTAHYGPYTGGEWIHSMGHTGNYFSQQYEGSGIPGGGFTPSHTWTEGFTDWYALSGDRTAAENAGLVADHYAGAYLSNYDFSNCRDNGWNLLLQMAAYRATGDSFYLNACRIIVERTLERQSPQGGWHRQMVPGHCLDFPRHRGEANFMLGVLANGLEQFWVETGDARVSQAIVGGAKQAIREMWVPAVDGFRYTSCPNMTGYIANNDMVAEVLFFAARATHDPLYGEVAMRAMQAAFKDGIGSPAHLRWTPRLLYNMDLLSRENAAFSREKGLRFLVRQDKAGPLDLWLGSVTGTVVHNKPELMTVVGPSGEVSKPDASGAVHLPQAAAGTYVVTVAPGEGYWQLRSSARSWVVQTPGDLGLRLGQYPAVLRVAPRPGAKLPAIIVTPDRKAVTATLGCGELKVNGQGAAGEPFTLQLPATASGGEWQLTLRGPGMAKVSLRDTIPAAALAPGQYFNPGAPVVTVDGPQALSPGQTKAAYTAQVFDMDDDVVSYAWQLPGGKTATGPRVEVEFATAGAQQLAVTVTDRQGNVATLGLVVSAPPPELAGIAADRVVTVQAEDFVAQGNGKVQLFQRIGCQGKMLSYWDQEKNHWLEWDVPVAVAGDYVLYLKYCSGAPQPPRRALLVDGKSSGPAFDTMTLPLTGGFCTERDNWAYYPAGNGQPLALRAGNHRLRLTNLGDGVGLDCLLLVRR